MSSIDAINFNSDETNMIFLLLRFEFESSYNNNKKNLSCSKHTKGLVGRLLTKET